MAENEEKNFSAWSDVDMQSETAIENAEEKKEEIINEQTKEEVINDELGAGEKKEEQQEEIKKEEIKTDEPVTKTPEELLKEITSLPENKDKSKEELQEILENKLNEGLNEELVLDVEGSNKSQSNEEEKIDYSKIALDLELVEKVEGDFKFDNLKEAFQTKLSTETEKIKDEYSVYDKLNPTAKIFVQFLNENGTDALQDFISPLSQYDKYLALPKEALVEENLKALKDEKGQPFYSEEEIADKMIEFEEEPSKLKAEYDKIRLSLIDGRKQSAQILAERLETEKQYLSQKKEESFVDDLKVLDEIKRTDSFAGVKISDNGKQVLAKSIEDKELQVLLKDPKFLANSILFHKFGDQALKTIAKVEFEKGKNKALSRQYNIPSINGGTPGSATNPNLGKSGTFSDWGKD